MTEYNLTIDKFRPYFAEIPYYLWGTVNYNSEGGCKCPTDRQWTWLELTRRDTGELLEVTSEGNKWKISGEEPIAARAAMFLVEHCAVDAVNSTPSMSVGEWEHSEALARARRVANEFESPKLKIFDSHLFWGSWKWVGWFATEFSWTGRWIMLSVIKGDKRGVSLCIDWLGQGTFGDEQSIALRAALHELTGESFKTDSEWTKWYNGGSIEKGAKVQYPEPDFGTWLEELKSEYGDSQQVESANT